MDIRIWMLIILIGCSVLYAVPKRKIIKRSKNNTNGVRTKFEISKSSYDELNKYIQKMPNQYKDNSRILAGSGKMHFSEAVVSGSTLIKRENVKVFTAVGDRFS